MSWKSDFQHSTTNIAFHLTLSRRMVIALVMVHASHNGKSMYGDYAQYERFGHFVPAVRNLINRGLVLHHDIVNRPAPPGHRWYTLTPAGELVYNLCVMAGLITAIEEAVNSEVA